MKPAGDNKGHRRNASVLVITDSIQSAEKFGFTLKDSGLETRLIHVHDPVLEVWAEITPDLLVIEDFNTRVEELSLCRQLRAQTVVPILYLTSKTGEDFHLRVYKVGADECISLPISQEMFHAKVHAWLRRTQTIPLATLDDVICGEFRLNVDSRRLILKNDEVVRLTILETRLLFLLMEHPGRRFEADQILEKVWGYYGNGDRHLLKNLVYRLRKKIEPEPALPRYLLTEGMNGYRFQPRVE